VELLETRLAPANVPVLSGHYDAPLSGANTQETTLTPANVNATNFGRLFNYAVDGYVYAQPLYVPNLAVAGGTHNVVFAATEHDSVYAFDADGGGQLWQRSFTSPGAGVTSVPQPDVISGDIVPEIGITGTPVIDATNTMYVVVKTKEIVGGTPHYVQRLHAVDITTGLDRAASGVVTLGDTTVGGPDGGYTDTTNVAVPGNGAGSDGTTLRFNALRENQRTALTLAGGIVYVSFASHGDNGPYHGWVIGYQASNLSLVRLFNTSPNGSASGIWESGGGLAVDPQGNLYFASGNGFGLGFDANVAPSTALGGGGGALGYQGIAKSVAVKFDFWKPSGNHSSTGLYFNGVAPDNSPPAPSVFQDLGGTPIDFNGSAQVNPPHTYQVQLVYNGSSLTETITDLNKPAPNSFSTTYNNVNIAGTVSGNTAYVGFTGGTGGATSIQDVLTWSYTSSDHTGGFANSDLQANGSASFQGTTLRLTDGGGGEAGSIFSRNAVNVTNFNTTFTFQPRPGSNPIADGLTFTIQHIPNTEYSESVLKLSTTGQLSVADYFTPFDWRVLDQNDADLGSGGTMLLPDAVGSAAHPHLMIETGKTGRMYLIDQANMGRNNPNPSGPDFNVQTVSLGGPGVWGNPAFFLDQPANHSGLIYYWGTSVPAEAFRITNGVVNPTPVSQTTFAIGFPGGQPSISANGTDANSAIMWALRVDNFGQNGSAELMAFKAEDLSQEIYSSNGTGLRDRFGSSVKFIYPIVSNGHVYAGSNGFLSVFGLFPAVTAAPNARSNLSGTAVQGGTQVQLTWTNPTGGQPATGIKILRSIDGVNYTPVNTVARDVNTYTDTGLTPATVYHYRVVATNQAGDSPPSNTLDIRTRIAAPILQVADICVGSIVLRWTATANDHYDLFRGDANGANLTLIATVDASQTTFTDTGLANGSYTYQVVGNSSFPEGTTDSAVSNLGKTTIGPITISHVDPTNPNAPGFFDSSDMQANGSAFFSTDEHLLRLNNNFGQAGSAFTIQQVGIRGFSTQFHVRLHEGTQPNPADGLTFTIQANGSTALGGTGGALGYQGIGRSVAIKFDVFDNEGESANSTGLFFNGDFPGIAHAPGEVNIALDPNNVNLRSQSIKTITLTYNGVAHTLTETIHDPTPGQTGNGDFTTTYNVDIAARLGLDTAFVGFTGGTGGLFSLQDVLNWSYAEQEGTLPPRAPTNLRVVQVDRHDHNRSNITIAWNCNNAYTAQGFVVEESPDGANWTPIDQVDAGTQTDTFLKQGAGVYYYRVRSFNDVGTSQPSNVTSVDIAGGDHPFDVTFLNFNNHSFLTANGPAHFTPDPVAVGTFPGHQDIGNTAAAGNATFDSTASRYTLNSSGFDIWDTHDAFQYVYKRLTGDGEVVARAINIQNTDFWAKGGVMMREGLDSNSKNAFTFETPSPDHEEPVFQWRTNTTGGSADSGNHHDHFGLPAPIWLRLVRSGNNFSGFWAQDLGGGNHGPWHQLGSTQTVNMTTTIYVGLALTGQGGRSNTSTFDNVSVTGDTSAPLPPTVARMTDGDFGEASTVFTNNAISFNNFTSSFTYRVDPRVGAADGLSFIMQADTRGAKAVGGAGGGLGYTGIANSIAVKFDIWNSATHRSSTGIYLGGEAPDSVAGRARSLFMDTDPSNVINFNSGHVFRIDFAYDSTALVLTETVTDTVTGAVFNTSYNVDIAANLGSNVGYVGFGGGTGGETAVQDILSWTYHSDTAQLPGGGDPSSPTGGGGPGLVANAALLQIGSPNRASGLDALGPATSLAQPTDTGRAALDTSSDAPSPAQWTNNLSAARLLTTDRGAHKEAVDQFFLQDLSDAF
jgi:hypothetical protein